jgi:hypothetical protein
LFALAVPATVLTQVGVKLTIENQAIAGTNFLFDIVLTRTGSNDLYLFGADFVLTFNSGNFTAPTITRGAVATLIDAAQPAG